MVNLAKFEGITPDDIIILVGLLEPAKEAKRLAQMLHQAYPFKPDEMKKVLVDNGVDHEYITRDNTWHYRSKKVKLDVSYTTESIFELLKAEFLVNAGYVDRYSNDLMSLTELDIQSKAFNYLHFKNFVKRTESQL